MTRTAIASYNLPQGVHIVILIAIVVAISTWCVCSIAQSVRNYSHPKLKALLPLFLLLIAWFLYGLVLILSVEGWQGATGLFSAVFSIGRLFAIEMAVLLILILALMYAIGKAIYLEWEKIEILVKGFRTHAGKAIHWVAKQLKSWKR